jgi:hypothetical protein
MSFTDVMKKAFPYISAAASLGGPVGTIAATIVGKAIGASNVEPTTEGISTAIAAAFADPQQRAALIQAEQQFQLQMAELGYKDAESLAATAEADRASAREREVQMKDLTPRVLAAIVLIAAFVGEGYVLRYGYPPNVAGELVGRILGTVDAAVMLVLSYYFGSSSGSDRKTELLAQSTPPQK